MIHVVLEIMSLGSRRNWCITVQFPGWLGEKLGLLLLECDVMMKLRQKTAVAFMITYGQLYEGKSKHFQPKLKWHTLNECGIILSSHTIPLQCNSALIRGLVCWMIEGAERLIQWIWVWIDKLISKYFCSFKAKKTHKKITTSGPQVVW